MICQKCNTPNQPDAQFCVKCGSPLGTAQPNSSSPSTGSVKMCPNGHIMDPSWDVCPYCPSPGQTPPPQQAGGSKKTVLESTGTGDPKPTPTVAETGTGMNVPKVPPAPPTVDESSRHKVHQQSPKPTIDESVARGHGYQPTVPDPVGRKTRLFEEKKAPIVGWLVATEGPGKGADYKIREGKNTIGNSPENAIRIDDDYSSGKHASLRYDNQQYTLTDLDSSNGTFVNDEEITKVVLKDNDIISIGETKLKFKGLFISSQTEEKDHEQ